MIEKKYNFDEYVNRLNTRSEKWDGASHVFLKPNLLPLWVADMDFLSPDPIREAILRRAEHGIYGYTYLPPSYFEAVINWFKRRHGWILQKDWLVFTPGVIPAINFAVQAFSKPHDKVIVQNPAYPPFFSAIKNNGRKKLLNPLKLNNNRYEMNLKDLEKKAKDPRAKMIILCNPHNPTARVWKKEELTQLGEICLNNQILILSDEIHCDLIYPRYIFTPFASISKKFSQNSITCTSPSKTFNLPGLKVSNIVIPNERLRNSFRQVLNCSGVNEPNCFASIALEVAYNECEIWLNQVLLYIKENLEFLKDFVKNNLSGVIVIEPEGTYLVWLDFRRLGLNARQLSKVLLENAKVALFEGPLFGKGGKGFNRINLACPRSILMDALNRIANAIKNR